PPGMSGAPGVTGVTTVTGTSGKPTLVVQAAMLARYNETTDTVGYGFGASAAVAFGDARQELRPLLGLALGTVRVSNDTGEFAHWLFAVQAGVLARFDRVYMTAALEGCLYSISVVSTTTSSQMATSAAELAIAGRVGLGYRFGNFEIGTGMRMLAGPTLWLEPVYAGLAF